MVAMGCVFASAVSRIARQHFPRLYRHHGPHDSHNRRSSSLAVHVAQDYAVSFQTNQLQCVAQSVDKARAWDWLRGSAMLPRGQNGLAGRRWNGSAEGGVGAQWVQAVGQNQQLKQRTRKPSSTEPPLLIELDPEPIPETLTAMGGVPLVVQTFRSLGLPSAVQQHVHVKER